MTSGNKTEEWLSIAEAAALEAGAYLLDSAGSKAKVNLEAGRDIKLGADVKSESIIVEHLNKETDFSILSEENGQIKRNDTKFTWIVDPLDGSLNYSRGIPLCCVSIALWEDMNPIFGIVYDFYRSEVYSGIVGKGARLNGVSIESSTVDRKEKAVLCTGFPVSTDFSSEGLMHFIKDIQEYKKIRLLGSAALSLVYVASGKADAYMENDIMIWDVAGGIAILKASGGSVQFVPAKKENRLNVKAANKFLL